MIFFVAHRGKLIASSGISSISAVDLYVAGRGHIPKQEYIVGATVEPIVPVMSLTQSIVNASDYTGFGW